MNKATRTHIRSLLWKYKVIKKTLGDFSDVMNNQENIFLEYPFIGIENCWTMNQIVFHKMFLQIISDILDDSTSEVQAIFNSKYLHGHPSKENAIVAMETFLSESTVKRRDNEFLKEIAERLGWLSV